MALSLRERMQGTKARIRGIQTEISKASPDNFRRGTSQFAGMAIGPGSTKEQIAAWVQNRSEFVKHNRNSVFIAVNCICRKMAMQGAKIGRVITKKSGETIEPVKYTHPLRTLLREVNPFMNEWELWYYTEGWKLLCGDSFLWKARNGFGAIKQLWPIPAQWVHVIPSSTRFIWGYEVDSFFAHEATAEIPAKDMVQIREPNLDWSWNGRFYGYSPLQAAASTVDIESNMFERLNASFKTYAQPGQIFTTDAKLSEHQLRQAYSQIISQHSLSEHYGKPMITHSGLKPTQQMSTVREMDYANSLEVTLGLTLAIFGVPKAVAGLVADQNRCLDEKTECLTDSGWKKYTELDMTTKIACYDPERKVLVYRKPSGVFVNKHKGKMLRWKSKVADVMVTPNHRLLGRTENSARQTMLAEEWLNEKSRFMIPVAPESGAACEPALDEKIPGTLPTTRSIHVPEELSGEDCVSEVAKRIGQNPSTIKRWISAGDLPSRMENGRYVVRYSDIRSMKVRTRGASTMRIDPVQVDAYLWLQFLGWYVSEGYAVAYRKKKGSLCHSVLISQTEKKYAQEIRDMLEKLPFKFHEVHPVPGHNQWTCNDGGLCRYLKKTCGTGSYDMRVPAHIKDYPAESLKVFLDAAIKGDGRFAPNHAIASYSTVSEGLADDIQEIAIKCGYRAKIHKNENKKHRPEYVVNICFERKEVLLRHDKSFESVDYDGDVWCVEVPTSYFVVRRNGKAHITGNSNLMGALQGFCSNVIEPRLKQNAQALTYGIARDFGEDLVIQFPKCTVDDVEQLRKNIETAQKGSAISPNETRAMLFENVLKDFETGGDQPLRHSGADEMMFGNIDEKKVDELTERAIRRVAENVAQPKGEADPSSIRQEPEEVEREEDNT